MLKNFQLQKIVHNVEARLKRVNVRKFLYHQYKLLMLS